MWVLFAITILTRAVDAHSEGEKIVIETLPESNFEDVAFDMFVREASSQGKTHSKPFAKEWKALQHKITMRNDDDDDGTEEVLTTDPELETRESAADTKPAMDTCFTETYNPLAGKFTREMNRLSLKCTIFLSGDEGDLDGFNGTENERRKGSTENKVGARDATLRKRETAPISTWHDWPAGDKVAPIQERSDSSQEKKSPAFYPWGGKRLSQLKQPPNIRVPTRVAFHSWGGKRNDKELESFRKNYDDKREKFFDWIGKSTIDLDNRGGKRDLTSSWGGRRVPFNSWGGKRISFNSWGGKRTPFNNWGGKRTTFNSWGGKRNPEEDKFDRYFNNYLENETSKRDKFNAWGGKRSQSAKYDDEEAKRTKFNAWGGKRSDLIGNWITNEATGRPIRKRHIFDGQTDFKMTEGKGKNDASIKEKRVPRASDGERRIRVGN